MRSSKRAVHVVKRKLADGTTKTYRYARDKKRARKAGKTVGDLLAAWELSPEWTRLARSTQDGYTRYTEPLLKLQNVPVANVERRQLIEMRNVMAKHRGNGAATAFVRAVSALFGWAVENGWLKHSPSVRMKRLEGGSLPAWTMEEARQALASLPEHLRRPVVMALYTGARRGDLCAMTWAQYDGESLRFVPQKTARRSPGALVIPCDPALKDELDAWKRDGVVGIAAAPILLNKFGRRWMPQNLSKQLQMALKAIPGFPERRNIHGLRKLAAANLAQNGCTLHEIAAITGHKSLAMLQLYTRSVDQERLAKDAISRRREK